MTNEELERAVERVDRWANYEWTTADQIAVKSELSTFTAGDLRALLSERAELLAAVERMRGALEIAAKTLDHVDGALMDMADAGAVPAVGTWRFVTQAAKRARAALTTGEGK